MKENKFVLEMHHISKSFPGVQALNDVDFNLYKGEVHALVGENGAGKSTLMKILSGFYRKDNGNVFINDEDVNIHSPIDAISLGISTIYQDIMNVPSITVGENILLGDRPRNRFGVIKWKELNRRVQEICDDLSIDLDPRLKVSTLSAAKQQLIEIVKALSFSSKIVIMDEPTAPLTEDEKNILFRIIRRMKNDGISIIYISHRMDEIFEICDRVTVFRDGKKIVTKPVSDTNHHEVIGFMIGREIEDMFEKEKVLSQQNVIMEVENVSNAKFFHNISFSVHKGEILGFAGLVGAGRSEVMKSIFGILYRDSGNIFIDGEKVDIKSPKEAIGYGIGMLPENRKLEGLIMGLPVNQNISISSLDSISSKGIIQGKKEKKFVEKYIDFLSIKCSSPSQQVMNLSGGNQQKVILSRWLLRNPKILILDEPTAGIDVGSKAEIHKLIFEIAKKGTTIIMISSEMTELLMMSNRIIVMKEGRIVSTVNSSEATEEIILRSMTGVHKQVTKETSV